MGTKSEWAVAGIEPSLEEIMGDPIMALLLRRDGLTDAAVWEFLEGAQSRLARARRSAATSGLPALARSPADGRRAEVRP